MAKKRIALLDLDCPKYGVASVGEERYVEVTHIPTGKIREYSNQSEFHGRNKKGGKLKAINDAREAKGKKPASLDDFEIVQKQRLKGPVQNVLHSAKVMMQSAIKNAGADEYEAYLGKGEPFRVELSTLKKYKGERDNLLKPILLDDVTEYLKKKFDGKVVTDIEVDDKLVMRCVELLNEGYEAFIIGEDKDYYGCPVQFYNINYPDEGVVDCRGFGSLWLETKEKPDGKMTEKVRGTGRLFKYWQICYGDDVDCYKANAHSSKRWGEKSAYKALVACKDDKEAWEKLVEVYKTLYPSPKKITTWKGDEIEIDWLYCLQEITDMAHLREKPEDRIDVRETLIHLDIKIGDL